MRQTAGLFLMALWLPTVAGCGVRPVAGGTAGTLRAGDEFPGDIQVTVHQVEGSAPRVVGFGVTASDGTFELVTSRAQGALWLSPGEYRFTLESAGAPLDIPKEYSAPDTTPLQVTWSAASDELELVIPTLAPSRQRVSNTPLR